MKYLVAVKETTEWLNIDVEAANETEAREKALDYVLSGWGETPKSEYTVTVNPLRTV